MSDNWDRFLRAPDDAAFRAVYDECKALAWTVCRRMLRRDEDAQDAFQSAWARLVDDARAGRIGREAAAREVVCRAAGREADALRKRLQRRQAREAAMDGAGVAERAAAGPAVDGTKMAMLQLVAELPDELRTPVELHFLHGLTHRETAAALGVAQSTVHSRLKSALRRLRPAAERAGLRDALGVLAAGGFATGLLVPPSSLEAAPSMAELAKAALPAAVAGGALVAKIAMAACACVVVVAALAFAARREARVEEPRGEAIVDARSSANDVRNDAANGDEEKNGSDAAHGREAASAGNAGGNAEAAAGADAVDAPLPRAVSVVATDARTGEPVRGARVEFEDVVHGSMPRKPGERYERHRTTDAEGVARVEDAPQGRVSVSVFGEGYANAGRIVDLGENDAAFAVDLQPGATILGTVRDEEGNALAGAEIRCNYSSTTPCDFETQTDAQGNYEIPHVAFAEAMSSLELRADGFEPLQSYREIAPPPGTVRHRVDFEMRRAKTYRGVVVSSASGEPIPHARVHGMGRLHLDPFARADEHGRFEITGEYAREGTVAVAAEGFAPSIAGLLADKETTVRLAAGWSVAGIVVDAQGNPVRGATAAVRDMSSGIFVPAIPVADDGTFDIRDLPKDAAIGFEAPGFSPTGDVLKAQGQVGAVVTMDAEGWVAGRVADAATGEPVTSFVVRVDFCREKQEGDRSTTLNMSLNNPGVTFDEADGAFRVGPLAAGSAWTLTVQAEGYAEHVVPRAVALPEPAAAEVLLERADGSVRGRVVDAEGAPVAGAVMTLLAHRDERHARKAFEWTNMRFRRDEALFVRTTATDADGAFAFDRVALPMGADLTAEAPDLVRVHRALDGVPQEPLELAMATGARLRVVLDREALPRVSAAVLWETGPGGSALLEFAMPLGTDVHEIGGLAPGRRLLSLHWREIGFAERSEQQSWSAEIDLRAGETTEVRAGFEGNFEVSGVCLFDGRPGRQHPRGDGTLAMATISRRVGGRWVPAGWCPVEQDGSFAFGAVPPGEYFVAIRATITSRSNPALCAGKHFVTVDRDVRGLKVDYMPTTTLRIAFDPKAWNREFFLVRMDGNGAGEAMSVVCHEGTTVLAELEPGTYELRRGAEDGGGVALEGIAVREGAGVAELGPVSFGDGEE